MEADTVLGKAALLEFPYRTTYDAQWSPLIQQVGYELVGTLESRKGDILKQTTGSHHTLIEVIGVDVVSSSYYKQFEWDFGVVKAPIVNALVLLGGIIRVTDKLLNTLSPTRGELAALPGHKIGHAPHRHSQKRIMKQKNDSVSGFCSHV